MKNYIIWDFDNTLALRPGGWTEALLEVAHRQKPAIPLVDEQIRPHLKGGFPWDQVDQSHLHICNSDQWWEALLPAMERVYCQAGLPLALSTRMARQIRQVYLEPIYWKSFEDAIPVLETLSNQGWVHFLLTNHVPELEEVLNYLGLSSYFSAVFNSAWTGYEKPHPQAYQNVLAQVQQPARIWMVGDNPWADIEGAKNAGIPAILVHRPVAGIEPYCETLIDVLAYLQEAIRSN